MSLKVYCSGSQLYEKSGSHLRVFSKISILSGAIRDHPNPAESNPIPNNQSQLHQGHRRGIPELLQCNQEQSLAEVCSQFSFIPTATWSGWVSLGS